MDMTEVKLSRVRAAAAELEFAINDLGGARVDVQCERVEVTKISDQHPRWMHALFVNVQGEVVRVYP